jgi:hypothetical protein
VPVGAEGKEEGKGMKFKPATAKTVAQVLRDMATACDEDKGDAKVYAEAVNVMLDQLLDEDFFGTEGQCDPRGDHRG